MEIWGYESFRQYTAFPESIPEGFQALYAKQGGLFRKDVFGIEKRLLDTGDSSSFLPSTYKPDWADILNRPTKLSQFTNDSQFITAAQAPVQSVNGRLGAVTVSEFPGWAGAPFRPDNWLPTLAEIGAEPAFTKNTAFNKNFGITAGTVAEGNDSRILNGQTAFTWGNHALAGYLKAETDPTVPAWVKGITQADISKWNTLQTLDTVVQNGFSTDRSIYAGGYLMRTFYDANTPVLNDARSGVYFFNGAGTSANFPNPYGCGMLFERAGTVNSSYNGSAFFFFDSANNNSFFFRKYYNGWKPWVRLWHSGDFTAADIANWNAAYNWGNPSGKFLPITGGIINTNNQWGGTLQIGRNGTELPSALNAIIGTTNGNLHIDSGLASGVILNYYSGGATYNNAVILANNGNLGIGLQTPAQKLDVKGNTKADALYLPLTQTGGGVGGISWRNGAEFYQTYMGYANNPFGIKGNVVSPTGKIVTTWGLRNLFADTNGFGWTWESTNSSLTTTPRMELSSYNGNLWTMGEHYVGANSYKVWHAGDFSTADVANWRTAYGWGNHAGLYLPIVGGTLSGALIVNSTITTNNAINLTGTTNTTSAIKFRGLNAIHGYDNWLRVNEASAFTSGIYTGTSVLRTDNALQVGSNGTSFLANSSGVKSIATFTGSGFIKNGSSNLYVLLGAGGHKLISDFPYLSSSGGNIVGNVNISGNLEVDGLFYVDRVEASEYLKSAVHWVSPVDAASGAGIVFSNYNDASKKNQIYYGRAGTNNGGAGNNLTIPSGYGVTNYAVHNLIDDVAGNGFTWQKLATGNSPVMLAGLDRLGNFSIAGKFTSAGSDVWTKNDFSDSYVQDWKKAGNFAVKSTSSNNITSSSYQQLSISISTTILVSPSSSNLVLYVPTVEDIRAALGKGSPEQFGVEITVLIRRDNSYDSANVSITPYNTYATILGSNGRPTFNVPVQTCIKLYAFDNGSSVYYMIVSQS